jgi:DEAD/DEAH box helicase domain-containing protein
MDNDEFAFGYEFVKKAIMREINFGESDIVGEKLTVSGLEEIRKGFKICKYCGKLQPQSGEPVHTFACKAKKPQPGNSDPFEEYLFLYREFITESLRILVPATTMDSSKVRQETFTAAFMLGMKEYFGNVDHLRACLSEVPVQDADYRKQYLVIYDSVPGGTGYLKQLLQQENAFTEILEKALAVLENCSCKDDPQKDGCYHCLYAYRQSQNIGQISRVIAMRLLKQILSGKENIEEIPKLANIPVNSLFESELERRFIEAFEKEYIHTGAPAITKQLVNGKEGYLLRAGDCRWEIEPQVLLDSRYGISVQSRADFVLWPVRAGAGHKPVVIFTDGFLYHKDKVADDTLKREAIKRSGQFRIWSLSWRDIQSVFQAQGDYATPTLAPEAMPSGARVYKPTIENGHAEELHPDKASPFELLVWYLERPDAERIFSVHAKAFAMSLLDLKNLNNSVAFADWNYMIAPIIDALAMRDTDFEVSNTVFGKWAPRNSHAHLSILSGVVTTDMQQYKANAVVTVCSLLNDDKDERTDKYEADWNGFWQFFNLMQFLPSFAAVTETGIEQGVYNAIILKEQTADDYVTTVVSDELWTEILEQLFDVAAKECANKLIALGVQAPSAAGYELINAAGAIIAECEIAWVNEKVALILPEQIESREVFEQNGWTVIGVDDEFSVDIFQGGTDR